VSVAPRSSGGFGRSVTRGCVAPGHAALESVEAVPAVSLPRKILHPLRGCLGAV
jgi:hypothetical protein